MEKDGKDEVADMKSGMNKDLNDDIKTEVKDKLGLEVDTSKKPKAINKKAKVSSNKLTSKKQSTKAVVKKFDKSPEKLKPQQDIEEKKEEQQEEKVYKPVKELT